MTTARFVRRLRALRRPRGLAALIVSMAVTAALALTACGAGRPVLGTSAGPCFAALPIARQAVRGRGSLAGIRLLDLSNLSASDARAMHRLINLLPTPRPHDVCLVAYEGSFTASQVERPVSPPSAAGPSRYAIAVVTVSKPELRATLVVRQEPLAFARGHVGF